MAKMVIPNGSQRVEFRRSAFLSLRDLRKDEWVGYGLVKLRPRSRPLPVIHITSNLVRNREGQIVLMRKKGDIDSLSLIMENSDLSQGGQEFRKWVHATVRVTATQKNKRSTMKFEVLEFPVRWDN